MTLEEKRERLDKLTHKSSWINGKLWQYMFGLTSCTTDVRSGGIGIECMLISCADDLYPDEPDKQKEMIENHMVYFNTETIMGSIVPGVVLGLEVEKAKGNDSISNDIIQSVKTALAGPFAGIGDSIIQGMIIPIIISISIGLSSSGSALGAVFMMLSYLAICFPITYYMFKLGVTLGVDGAEKILSSGIKDRLLNSIQVLGLLVVGAVTASASSLNVKAEFNINNLNIKVQDYLDRIYPGVTVLLAAFTVYWLIRYKKISPLKVMGILVAFSAAGHFLHIL